MCLHLKRLHCLSGIPHSLQNRSRDQKWPTEKYTSLSFHWDFAVIYFINFSFLCWILSFNLDFTHNDIWWFINSFRKQSGFQLDIRSAKCQIQCCIWGRRWSRLSSPHLAPLLLVHCFLCLTDVRHAATGSVPEMLQWEETEGSRGISQVWREISPWTEVSASLHAGNDRL